MPRIHQNSQLADAIEVPGSSSREDRVWRLVGVIAFALFLAASIGYSLTRCPWWDEGVFADVAMNVRNAGRLGSIVLAPHGYLNWPGVHQYTYWQLPLYLIVEGAWIRVFPATIQWMRLLSVTWGSVYLAAWFLFVRALSRNARVALWIASVIAVDYAVLSAASDARMDMMCAALGQAALAAYACLRLTRPKTAIILAGFFGAGSLFCHPMGAVMNFALIAVILFLDFRRIRWSAIPVAALFYVLGVALCVRYAMEAPQYYRAQSSAAASYREMRIAGILHNIATDAYHRYYLYYFGGLSGINKLKILALLFVAAGFLAVALNRRLRTQLLGKVLLLLAVCTYAGVAAVDNQDFPIYFIYSIPAFTACGAFWVYEEWRTRRGAGRMLASVLLLGAVGSSLAGFAIKIGKRDLQYQYDGAVEVIRKNLPPGGTVYGGAELGFALGFGPQLVDDRYLGYWSGAPLPAIYAMNPIYVPMETEMAAWNASRAILAHHYRLIFQDEDYRVYLRDDLPLRT